MIMHSSGWLTGNEIIKQVKKKRIIIDPFEEQNINPNSYNYHLDRKLLRIENDIIDLTSKDEYEEIIIPDDGYILKPDECYLGSTCETFGSDYFASLVTGRSSLGRKFITNHITAGLIDQGFVGKITLEITVQKPTRIYYGIEFGQIFWFTVKGLKKLYNGKYQGQEGATISKIYDEYKLSCCKTTK
jgi:dCTP deaminase